jgi:hypothetical protein
MVNNLFNVKKNQGTSMTQSEVSRSTINQMNYLQQILGNKEVTHLIEMGIIQKNRPVSPDMGIITNQKKKEEYEVKQIEKDKDELMKEIEEKVMEKKEEADSLYLDGSSGEVFVNVNTNIMYAEIPGEPPLLFYHYLDLVDISFSYQDINKQGEAKDIKRGQIIPYTFSYKYEPEKEIPKQREEEGSEQAADEKNKVDKKKKDSLKKEDIKEDISTTVFKGPDSKNKAI